MLGVPLSVLGKVLIVVQDFLSDPSPSKDKIFEDMKSYIRGKFQKL